MLEHSYAQHPVGSTNHLLTSRAELYTTLTNNTYNTISYIIYENYFITSLIDGLS